MAELIENIIMKIPDYSQQFNQYFSKAIFAKYDGIEGLNRVIKGAGLVK